jgi:hypothetical protein
MPRHPRICFAALVLGALALAGCVERKLLIRSDPPGATVTLNRGRTPAGTTPLSIPYHYYGTYDVRIEKEGYRPLHVDAPVSAPWYEYPVLDFFAELLLPVTIHDDREFSWSLEPRPPAPAMTTEEEIEKATQEAEKRNAELLERAKKMRKAVDEGDPAKVR